MSDDVFSSDLPDLQGMIKKLDMFNENANKAVRTALHSGADKIVSEQKRLAPEKTREAISKGKVYTTKKGVLGIAAGYRQSAFKTDSEGFNPGIVGTVFEFGRPGQSAQRSKPTMKQVRHGKEVEVLKGTIQPQPHIRRGFDNKVNEAVKGVIESVDSELKKLEKG